ncbi:hypothetical protein [Devosia epidermidihirudinis]|nr:hypothetical protein [Devosia epidermidihirudinis]
MLSISGRTEPTDDSMTDQNPTPQVSAQQLLNIAIGTHFGRAVSGAVVGFIGLLLPFVSISTNLGVGLNQSGSLNGFEAAGWAAWLALLAFIAAAASWKVAQLAPYRLILSGVAGGLALLSIIVGLFFNPASKQLNELNSALAQLGTQGNLVNIGPHIGMLLVLIGGGVIAWVGWQARNLFVTE